MATLTAADIAILKQIPLARNYIPTHFSSRGLTYGLEGLADEQARSAQALQVVQAYKNGGLPAANQIITAQSQHSGGGGLFGGLGDAFGSLLSSGAAPIFLGSIAGSLAGLGNVAPAIAGAGAATGAGATSATGAGMLGLGGQLLSSSAPIMSAGYTAPAIATGAGMLTPEISSAAQTLANAGITPQVMQQATTNPGMLSQISQATGLTIPQLGQVAATGLGLLGSYLQGSQAQDAAQTSANAQIEAARIAAEAAKFKPVGVTTRFGQSQFGYNPQGNLVSAGYTPAADIKAQQDALMAASGGMLNQFTGSQAATAPLGAGAQQSMALGQGYLQTSPQAQAAQYMAEQQALLAPDREREMAALQARLQAQGRGGLAMGATTTGMTAANPELEAYYNAKRMQDLQLAAQATQGGMDYAKYGAGMVGTGGDLLKQMYSTQQSAYNPYQTAIGGANSLENLAMQPLDIGMQLGSQTTAAAAAGGRAMQTGMTGAAQTMLPANAYSPWGALLTGAGQAVNQYNQPQQQPGMLTYNPAQYRLAPLGSA